MARPAPEMSRASAGTGKVGFLLTEVDAEYEGTGGKPGADPKGAATPASASPHRASEKGKGDANATLPLINVLCVEDAQFPNEVSEESVTYAPLPATIPMEKVMNNIVQNLNFKAWSEEARNTIRNQWFSFFKSPASMAVVSDIFWFCICFYFKAGQHPDFEKQLFNRISTNFVGLFNSVTPPRKDFCFRHYADAAAQAILYAMFLAYPKSRSKFVEKFRKDLVIRISYWTTGICPEFVNTSHWKLNLGGGDVLQTMGAGGRPVGGAATQPILGQFSADSLEGRRASLAHRPPRPLRTLRYSPLVAHFLRTRKYSSVNLVRTTKMNMTTAEERAKLMDVKHAMLVERATVARERCDKLVHEYDGQCAEVKRQERQGQMAAQTAKKRLEIRRKEVLRSDPHEYANYLVSLHILQEGLSQTA